MTLTLNRVIWHTVMHHSSTSMYVPNFIEIGQSFCGWTYERIDERTDGPTDGWTFPPLMVLGWLGGVDLIKLDCNSIYQKRWVRWLTITTDKLILHLQYFQWCISSTSLAVNRTSTNTRRVAQKQQGHWPLLLKKVPTIYNNNNNIIIQYLYSALKSCKGYRGVQYSEMFKVCLQDLQWQRHYRFTGSPKVKEFWKSISIWWSYRQYSIVTFLIHSG